MIFRDPLRGLCDRFGIILIDGTNSVSVLPPIGNVLGENYQHSHEVSKLGKPEEAVVAELMRVVGLGIFPCDDAECGICL